VIGFAARRVVRPDEPPSYRFCGTPGATCSLTVDRSICATASCDLRQDRAKPQPDGSLRSPIELWPRQLLLERPSHRVQVCSGGIPAGPATWRVDDEPLATATHWQGSEQVIYHDAAHPSTLILRLTSWWRDTADIEVLQYT